MTRDDALDCLAREGIFMVSAEHGGDIARAFGTNLDEIGIAPTPADTLALAAFGQFAQDQVMVRVKSGKNGIPRMGIPGAKAVWTWQLAALLGVHFGLFHDIDHASQTPWHKAQSEARYISGRAAVRLAAYFGGAEGVDRLRERNPFLPAQLFSEAKFTGTGQRADRERVY